jgi:hypothetical protein
LQYTRCVKTPGVHSFISKHFDSWKKKNLANVQRVLVHTALHCVLALTAINRKDCPKINVCCVYVVTKEHVCTLIVVVTGEFVTDGLLVVSSAEAKSWLSQI